MITIHKNKTTGVINSEIRSAKAKMKRNKKKTKTKIIIEILSAIVDVGIDMIDETVNEIYDNS